MVVPIIASMIASGLSAASAAATNSSNRRAVEKRNQEQIAANAAAWQRETSYNHPAQQLARLRAAGLNPNLMYQSAPQNTANMVAPEIQAPQASAPMIDGHFADLMQNSKLIAAQTRKTENEANNVDLNNEILSANKDSIIKLSHLNVEMTETSIAYTDAQKQAIAAQINEINARIDNIDRQTQHISWQENKEWKEFLLHNKEVNAQLKLIATQCGKTVAETREIVQTLGLKKSLLVQQELNMIEQRTGLRLDNSSKDTANKQASWNLKLSYDFDEQMRRAQYANMCADATNSWLDVFFSH